MCRLVSRKGTYKKCSYLQEIRSLIVQLSCFVECHLGALPWCDLVDLTPLPGGRLNTGRNVQDWFKKEEMSHIARRACAGGMAMTASRVNQVLRAAGRAVRSPTEKAAPSASAASSSTDVPFVAPQFHPAGPMALFQEKCGLVVKHKLPVGRDQTDYDVPEQVCYWTSGRDRFGPAGPMHVSTDAASMYTSADLQNYSWLEPDWRGSDIDKEIAMWSPLQVSLLLENMPGGFVASNLRV